MDSFYSHDIDAASSMDSKLGLESLVNGHAHGVDEEEGQENGNGFAAPASVAEDATSQEFPLSLTQQDAQSDEGTQQSIDSPLQMPEPAAKPEDVKREKTAPPSPTNVLDRITAKSEKSLSPKQLKAEVKKDEVPEKKETEKEVAEEELQESEAAAEDGKAENATSPKESEQQENDPLTPEKQSEEVAEDQKKEEKSVAELHPSPNKAIVSVLKEKSFKLPILSQLSGEGEVIIRNSKLDHWGQINPTYSFLTSFLKKRQEELSDPAAAASSSEHGNEATKLRFEPEEQLKFAQSKGYTALTVATMLQKQERFRRQEIKHFTSGTVPNGSSFTLSILTQGEGDDGVHDDNAYAKVQQFEWENLVIWEDEGEKVKKSKQTVEVLDTFVEEFDSDDERSKRRVAAPGLPHTSPTKPSGASDSQRILSPHKEKGGTKGVAKKAPQWHFTGSVDPSEAKPGQWSWELVKSSSSKTPTVKTARKGGEEVGPQGGQAAAIHSPKQGSHSHGDKPSSGSSKDKIGSPQKHRHDHSKLPSIINHDILGGSWVDDIIWDKPPETEAKLILDQNDKNMILIPSDTKPFKPTLKLPVKQVGMDTARKLKEKARQEKGLRTGDAISKIVPTSMRETGNEYGDRNEHRIATTHQTVIHSLVATKLTLTKPELSKDQLREPHRPRSKFKRGDKVQLLALTDSDKTGSVDDKGNHTIKKASDLYPTDGSLILLEYVEQKPPILCSVGMASLILNYFRPPENEPNAEPPPVTEGQRIKLGEREDSPFIGDVPPGVMVTALHNNLYKAPLFQHQPVEADNLFLLLRTSKKGKERKKKKELGLPVKAFVIELPKVFTAGQIEPQQEVPAPNSKPALQFIRPYMQFHILRLFKKSGDDERLRIDHVKHAFPSQSQTAIRKQMKEMAIFDRGGNDNGWWRKQPKYDLPSTEDQIREQISPESVCLYESMMAGHRTLLDAGITKMTTPSNIDDAVARMEKRIDNRKRMLSSLVTTKNPKQRQKEIHDLVRSDKMMKQLEMDIKVARFIAMQLQLTPWSLTGNFVECHIQGNGILRIGGPGDPSGVGEGFSFLREATTRGRNKKDGDGDDDAASRMVAAVTGTQADLRKLTMKQLGDILMKAGLQEAEIKRLKRWDRVDVIRKYSTKASERGIGGAYEIWARHERRPASQQRKDYLKKCNKVYKKQLEALASNQTVFLDFEDSDSDEENEDDHVFDKTFEDDLKDTSGKLTSVGMQLNTNNISEREDARQLRLLKESMRQDGEDPNRAKQRAAGAATGASGGSSTAAGPSAGPSASSGPPASSSLFTLTALGAGGGAGSSAGNPNGGFAALQSSPKGLGGVPFMDAAVARAKLKTSSYPGRKAIKRTTRVLQEDGTEKVTIRFIVDSKIVHEFIKKKDREERSAKIAAQRAAAEEKKKRKREFEEELDEEQMRRKKRQLQEELKQLRRTKTHNEMYQRMLQEKGSDVLQQPGLIGDKNMRCTSCGQKGHMRTNRICPLYRADEVSADGMEAISRIPDDPLKLKINKNVVRDHDKDLKLNISNLQKHAQKHKAELRKRRLLEAQELAEMYKKPTKAQQRGRKKRYRMPSVHFNALLEEVFYLLYRNDNNMVFRHPVDGRVVKDYYSIVKTPMDLSTIRSRIETFDYTSRGEFLADLEQIHANSKLYNGPTHDITNRAAKLIELAKKDLARIDFNSELTSLEAQLQKAR